MFSVNCWLQSLARKPSLDLLCRGFGKQKHMVSWATIIIPATGQLKQWTFISHSSEGWKSRIKVQADRLEACRWLSSLCALTPPSLCTCGGRLNELCSFASLLRRTLILSDQGPTLMISFNLNYFHKALSPEVRASAYIFGEIQTFSPSNMA